VRDLRIPTFSKTPRLICSLELAVSFFDIAEISSNLLFVILRHFASSLVTVIVADLGSAV
jgi:hypothetical protein